MSPVTHRDMGPVYARLADELARFNRHIETVEGEAAVRVDVVPDRLDQGGRLLINGVGVGEECLCHRTDDEGGGSPSGFIRRSLDEHALALRETFTDDFLHRVHDVVVRTELALSRALNEDHSPGHDSSPSVGVDSHSEPTGGEPRPYIHVHVESPNLGAETAHELAREIADRIERNRKAAS